MPLEWKDANDVVARLGEKFMKRVLENAGRVSFVRFGVTGSGQYPNYQVEVVGADPVPYAGLTHKVWPGDIRTFESDNLSQQFASADLLAAFVKQFRQPRAR